MYKEDQTSALNTGFANETDTGFVGFLQPKYLNGTWGYQDPIFCSPLLNFTSCYLNPNGHETYEGSSWLYTFYVPQDMASAAMMGKRIRSVEAAKLLAKTHQNGVVKEDGEYLHQTTRSYPFAEQPVCGFLMVTVEFGPVRLLGKEGSVLTENAALQRTCLHWRSTPGVDAQ